MMIFQSTAVGEILLGRDAGWQVQRRDDGGVPRAEVFRRYALPTLFGVVMTATAYAVSVPLLLWMTPVILGLLLAIPIGLLSSSTGSANAGPALFRTPEQTSPPNVLVRANELANVPHPPVDCPLRALRDDPLLRATHLNNLPVERHRAARSQSTHISRSHGRRSRMPAASKRRRLSRPKREMFAVLTSPAVLAVLLELPDSV